MGYYSDVVLALNENGKALLNKKIAELKEQDTETWQAVDSLLNNYVDHKQEDPISGAIMYNFAMLKWYDSFTDIGFVVDFINTLSSEDYLFIRIGEDIDDIQREGSFFDNPFNIEVISTIQYAFLSEVET